MPEDREQEMESSNEQEITEGFKSNCKLTRFVFKNKIFFPAIKQFTISGKTIEDLTTEDSADSEDDVDRISM